MYVLAFWQGTLINEYDDDDDDDDDDAVGDSSIRRVCAEDTVWRPA